MELNKFVGGQCEVAVVEHSLNTHTNKQLITFQLRYPRFIHAEFMTHRMFSRNAGSSRAIPTAKLMAQVREQPAFFVHVGQNQPGMQAHEEVAAELRAEFYTAWKAHASAAADFAEKWSAAGIHKQVVNRVLEPFNYISVVVTATEWDNWYELRNHDDAQPEIHDLAATMLQAVEASAPRHLVERDLNDPKGWHLSYVSMDERKTNVIGNLLAMSAARSGRVSYLTHDKLNPVVEDDIKLYRRLVESRPLHASPLEHQAVCVEQNQRSRNLTGGWVQHRTFLEEAGSIENLQEFLEAS